MLIPESDRRGVIGAIAVDNLQNIPTLLWSETQVREVMQPITQATTVQPNQPLLKVVQLLEQHKTICTSRNSRKRYASWNFRKSSGYPTTPK